MLRRSSLGWPITLAVVMIVLVVLLTVGWVIVTAIGALNAESPGPYWAMLIVGTTFLVLVLVGTVLYLVLSIKEIRFNQRQSNFMDAVTHELKSPIASLKLSLQTLDRRKLSDQQQADFHRFMFQDLERLDSLIDHLLDAARSEKSPADDVWENVDLSAVLQSCVEAARARYNLSEEAIRLTADAATVQARPMDLEILFRNLIDNAVKYSGSAPQVEIEAKLNGQGVVTTIADNGPGIPSGMRRKIFGRFVRLGNELERTKTGTGLGLYIVRTLVKQLKGSIEIQDRGAKSGTLFEVTLPVVHENAEGRIQNAE